MYAVLFSKGEITREKFDKEMAAVEQPRVWPRTLEPPVQLLEAQWLPGLPVPPV
jgi:hypothetical protein